MKKIIVSSRRLGSSANPPEATTTGRSQGKVDEDESGSHFYNTVTTVAALPTPPSLSKVRECYFTLKQFMKPNEPVYND